MGTQTYVTQITSPCDRLSLPYFTSIHLTSSLHVSDVDDEQAFDDCCVFLRITKPKTIRAFVKPKINRSY